MLNLRRGNICIFSLISGSSWAVQQVWERVLERGDQACWRNPNPPQENFFLIEECIAPERERNQTRSIRLADELIAAGWNLFKRFLLQNIYRVKWVWVLFFLSFRFNHYIIYVAYLSAIGRVLSVFAVKALRFLFWWWCWGRKGSGFLFSVSDYSTKNV